MIEAHLRVAADGVLKSETTVHFVCAGPGYGKTTFLRYLQSQVQSHCIDFIDCGSRQFSGCGGASRLIDLLERKISDAAYRIDDKLSVILIDAADSITEPSALNHIGCLLKTSDGSVKFVFALRDHRAIKRICPHEIRLEIIGCDALRIGKEQLFDFMREHAGCCSHAVSARIIDETHGWPALVAHHLAVETLLYADSSNAARTAAQGELLRVRSELWRHMSEPQLRCMVQMLAFPALPLLSIIDCPDVRAVYELLPLVLSSGLARVISIDGRHWYEFVPAIRCGGVLALEQLAPPSNSTFELSLFDVVSRVNGKLLALDLAIRSGRWAYVIGALHEDGEMLFMEGNWQILSEVGDKAPTEYICSSDNAYSFLILAKAFLKDFDGARLLFNRCTPFLQSGNASRVASEISIVMKLMHEGRVRFGLRLAEQILHELPENAPTSLRGLTLSLQGAMQLMNGDVKSSIETMEKSVTICQETGFRLATAFSMSFLAYAYAVAGRFSDACRIFDVIEEVADGDWRIRTVAGGYYASIAYELGMIENLSDWLLAYEAAWPVISNSGSRILLSLVKFKLAYFSGAGASAITELEAAAASCGRVNRVRFFQAVLLEKSRVERSHVVDDAMNLIESSPAEVRLFPSELLEDSVIATVRAMLAFGRAESAIELLSGEARVAEENGAQWRLLKIKVLLAISLLSAGRLSESAVAIADAARRSASTGAVGCFLEEGDIVLEAIANGTIYEPSSRGVLDKLKCKLLAVNDCAKMQYFSKPSLSEKVLNRREGQILKLFASGLPAKSVATELNISVNTVKWHSANILRKLGVINKTSAIALAREMGLL